MVDVASLVVQVKSDGVKQTEKDLKNLGEQAGKTANQTEQVGQKAKVVQGNFKAMKGSTQQVSYQLQDIAIQAQMGTDAFVILGQQGPQLASIFGPGGAVVGA
jgi:transcription antitermination factor NusG